MGSDDTTTNPGDDDDVLKEAKDAFKLASDWEKDNRLLAEKDLRFSRLGDQWEPDRDVWRKNGILVVDIDGVDNLGWADRELLRGVGDRLYGQREVIA